MRRAVFFTVKSTIDDGEHPGYLPGVAAAMDALCGADLLRIAIHHHPGMEEAIQHYVAKMLKRELGISYSGTCGHWPHEKCICAKPSPMLILGAAKAMNVDLANSFFVGASYDDVSMARAAGIGSVSFVVPNTGGFSDVVRSVILPAVQATPHPAHFERS